MKCCWLFLFIGWSLSVKGIGQEQVVPHPWRAAAGVTLINAGVWSFNRFVTNEPFARVSGKALLRNLTGHFVWDNDKFSTNMLSHPYHGSLYFTAARVNGLSFYGAVPYTLGGSLMWEWMGENEPPSVNDVLATTFGGVALGEVSVRLSDSVLDESKQGVERFFRELAATLLSPVTGLERLFSGRMWRVSHKRHKPRVPAVVGVDMGVGGISAVGMKGAHQQVSPYLCFSLQYGDWYAAMKRPYDCFSLKACLSLAPTQPLITELAVEGRLWSKEWSLDSPDARGSWELVQLFNYQHHKVAGEENPFRYAEAAAVGTGFHWQKGSVGRQPRWSVQGLAKWVLLGGVITEHYRVIERDYNLGSGIGLKGAFCWTPFPFLSLGVELHATRLFTWKGYDEQRLRCETLYVNVQGDKGHFTLWQVEPHLRVRYGKRCRLQLSGMLHTLQMHYNRFPDRVMRGGGMSVSVGYTW